MSRNKSGRSSGESVLDVTKISHNWRICLVQAVREEFSTRGVEIEEGDRLVYKASEGKIVIELA